MDGIDALVELRLLQLAFGAPEGPLQGGERHLGRLLVKLGLDHGDAGGAIALVVGCDRHGRGSDRSDDKTRRKHVAHERLLPPTIERHLLRSSADARAGRFHAVIYGLGALFPRIVAQTA
jgi:hypothetical protein